MEQPTLSDLSTPAPAQSRFWAALAHAVMLIFLVQAARAALTVMLYLILKPAPSSPVWALIDMIAFSIIGLALLIFRPGISTLGLDWFGMQRRLRLLTIAGGVILLALVATTFAFGADIMLDNIRSVLFIPIFEELIFRGWIWGRLDLTARKPWQIWLLTSVLFSLWHLGYWDIYTLKAFPSISGVNVPFFVAMKLATTLVIGLLVGLPRWKTNRVYGSILLHGLINLFGK